MAEQHGAIRIADDVVAVIASLAAEQTKGVSNMSGGLTEGWTKRVSGKNVTRGVTVEVGEVEAAIDLRVIVDYGVKIHEVARLLQANVQEAVETMTGLHVVEINVKVEGIGFSEEKVEDIERVK
ncbi:Asp23/Gls24 family envelope stress response protein [Mechercharimyces sp. CAU 1602]|uniref:Asp23/Gls24 family envelope stress response protein n=1 Tax=Mechercharimyces sp. CAU 1602 TaxID=2973933 RepID=UPI002163A2A9|nr:Asp23/Gls24 family envelope stress response protein [Mechercharimyces sp. CAU 1602]MCS1350146.1 Asp23/Gls24 family envelope stress response protein [Mechercharimyces sp. CAU 1602]